MFYIEENEKIVLFDNSKEKLVNTIKFMPKYKNYEIKETDRQIIDFEFTDTQEWKTKEQEKSIELKKQEILSKLQEIDTKRIRAICEGGENPETQESWLDYYNKQASDLRIKLKELQ